MTTIAVKDGVMASDSQGTSSYIQQHKFVKVKRINDCLIGSCGGSAACDAFADWFEGGAKPKKFPEICASKKHGCSALVLRKKGLVLYESGPEPVSLGKIAAIGSGSEFAMGAMLAGANAAEAVKISAKLDPYTGGRIVSHILNKE